MSSTSFLQSWAKITYNYPFSNISFNTCTSNGNMLNDTVKGKTNHHRLWSFLDKREFFSLQSVSVLPVESEDIHLWLRYSVSVTEPLCQGFL